MTFEEELKKLNNPIINIIAEYLMSRDDIQENLKKPNKSLEEMYEYILSEAKKKAVQNCAAMTDEEVFGLAVHYYDEDDLKIKKVSNVQVTTNAKEKKISKENSPTKQEKKKQPSKQIEEEQISLF